MIGGLVTGGLVIGGLVDWWIGGLVDWWIGDWWIGDSVLAWCHSAFLVLYTLQHRFSFEGGNQMKQWDTSHLEVIERDPNKLSGTWVFRGTRIPVSALFENLRDGATVEQFVEWFPGIKRSQVESVLNYELMTYAIPKGHAVVA